MSKDGGFTAAITGTYLPCEVCRALMIFADGESQQRVTVSGNPAARKITPHTEVCPIDTRTTL